VTLDDHDIARIADAVQQKLSPQLVKIDSRLDKLEQWAERVELHLQRLEGRIDALSVASSGDVQYMQSMIQSMGEQTPAYMAGFDDVMLRGSRETIMFEPYYINRPQSEKPAHKRRG